MTSEHELCDELARLMAKPDSRDPNSDTARAIAEVDRQLCDIEGAQAEQLAAEFEARLLMPLDRGLQTSIEFDQLIARYSVVKGPEDSNILGIMTAARKADIGTIIVVPLSSSATAADCEASKRRFGIYGVGFIDEAPIRE